MSHAHLEITSSTRRQAWTVKPPAKLAGERFLALAEKRIRAHSKRAVGAIAEIGRELVIVKARVEHGKYTAFVTERLGWSEAAAKRFISVYEMIKTLNLSDLESLQIDASSLYLLAAPSTPEAAREEVLERAATPEGITHAATKHVVANHKAAVAPAPKPAPAGPPVSWGRTGMWGQVSIIVARIVAVWIILNSLAALGLFNGGFPLLVAFVVGTAAAITALFAECIRWIGSNALSATQRRRGRDRDHRRDGAAHSALPMRASVSSTVKTHTFSHNSDTAGQNVLAIDKRKGSPGRHFPALR
jgi:hypothetical protein